MPKARQNPLMTVIFLLFIGAAIVATGLLARDERHLLVTLFHAPVWMAFMLPLCQVAVGIIIVCFAGAARQGALNALAIVVLGLLPAIVGAVPGGYLGLKLGAASRRFTITFRDKMQRPVKLSCGKLRVIKHYTAVERLLPKGLGADRIGSGVAYADAVPWKSKSGPRLDPEVVGWARERVQRILASLRPQVVLTLGAGPAKLFDASLKKDPKIAAWMLGSWQGAGLALFHSNAQVFRGGGSKRDYEARVSQQIAKALS